jgi:hypothetical protein
MNVLEELLSDLKEGDVPAGVANLRWALLP